MLEIGAPNAANGQQTNQNWSFFFDSLVILTQIGLPVEVKTGESVSDSFP